MNDVMLAAQDLGTWVQAHMLLTIWMAAVLLIPGLLCCWAARQGLVVSRRGLQRVEERLQHLHTAVELLTDTTEAGLQAAFAEIEKLNAASGSRTLDRAGLEQRVRSAARGGETARAIARREGLSEGEVHLRLTLPERPSFGPTPARLQ